MLLGTGGHFLGLISEASRGATTVFTAQAALLDLHPCGQIAEQMDESFILVHGTGLPVCDQWLLCAGPMTRQNTRIA